MPAWNLPSPAITQAAWERPSKQLALEEEETIKLEQLLVKLARVPSLSGIKAFLEKAPVFRSPIVARRWRLARQQHRKALSSRGKDPTQQMREFGILESEENEFRKGLWLDEMLKIEEEVRPYMA